MNHELAMLRGMKFCKNAIRGLTEECMNMALKSYMTDKWKGGTLEQLEKVKEIACKRDKFQLYLEFVRGALEEMPKGERALIVAVYLKGIPKEVIASRYGVSRSTVYRKLAKAREYFRNNLEVLGCTEQWLQETFADVDWLKAMLNAPNGGCKLPE